jgi:cyclopropane-fatty-acyl-phospholipid synthase
MAIYLARHADVEVLGITLSQEELELARECAKAAGGANRDKIEAMFDERFFRMWVFYLAGAASVFESGGMCNYQIQFSRNRYTLPSTRDYIGETERSPGNQSG